MQENRLYTAIDTEFQVSYQQENQNLEQQITVGPRNSQDTGPKEQEKENNYEIVKTKN